MSSWRQLPKRIGLGSAVLPSGASRARVALLLCAGLVLGGCSTTLPSPTGGLFGGLVAAVTEQGHAPAPPVETEADGLEAQRPPLLRMYSKPDDPTQPFSPNYGAVPLAVTDNTAENNADADTTSTQPLTAPTKEAAIRSEHPI